MERARVLGHAPEAPSAPVMRAPGYGTHEAHRCLLLDMSPKLVIPLHKHPWASGHVLQVEARRVRRVKLGRSEQLSWTA